MEETQEILRQMGFENPNDNVWKSQWFGYFILAKEATPQQLALFIFDRGYNKGLKDIPCGQIKPTIPNTDNEWIDINFLLPETGVTVLCKLSKDIGLGTTEKKLYRMKYNGKWNDYDHLVTHWKIIGKNKIKVHYAWEIKPTIEGNNDKRGNTYEQG